MLAGSDTMTRRTLRDLMYELPDDLLEFEIEGVHLLHPDDDWLEAGRPTDLATEDDEGNEAFGGDLDARPASAA